MSASYFKRPDETLHIPLDFSEFIAEHPEATISYELRAALGVTVDTELLGDGVFLLHVSGGVTGRAYRFGIEAQSSDGDIDVQMVTLRLRSVPGWESVPVVGDIGSGSNFILLVDADGNALVDANGNALVIAG